MHRLDSACIDAGSLLVIIEISWIFKQMIHLIVLLLSPWAGILSGPRIRTYTYPIQMPLKCLFTCNLHSLSPPKALQDRCTLKIIFWASRLCRGSHPALALFFLVRGKKMGPNTRADKYKLSLPGCQDSAWIRLNYVIEHAEKTENKSGFIVWGRRKRAPGGYESASWIHAKEFKIKGSTQALQFSVAINEACFS